MTNVPDYKTAYETLTRAIDEATLILQRAQIMTSCGLKMGQGEELTEEDLEKIREVNSRT